jgi:hypothetical protein
MVKELSIINSDICAGLDMVILAVFFKTEVRGE